MKQEYVKIGAVAKEFAVSVSTIRKWLREGKIPRDTYIKAGRTYRFDVAAMTEALRGGPPLQVELTPTQTAMAERLGLTPREGEGSDDAPTWQGELADSDNSLGIAALDDFDEDY
jgi:excisionase family DNA binding protein